MAAPNSAPRAIDLPLLAIISGAPGSGKSTLAALLAPALRLPLLAKDEIKETLYDSLGAPDVETSRRLGAATYEVLWVVVRRLLDAGVGAVLESNFYHGFSEAKLAPHVAKARAVIVHCHTSRENIALRYAGRARRGERHPAHFDLDRVDHVLAALDAGRFEPMELDIPVLLVDTTQGYQPAFQDILAFIRAST